AWGDSSAATAGAARPARAAASARARIETGFMGELRGQQVEKGAESVAAFRPQTFTDRSEGLADAGVPVAAVGLVHGADVTAAGQRGLLVGDVPHAHADGGVGQQAVEQAAV